VGWLVETLKYGIRVTKVAYNGGVPASRFLWLEGDVHHLGTARLCIASKMSKGSIKTKGLFLADIAEVRANASSYTFKLSGTKPLDSDCLSIIGTERSIDLLFYKGEMYGKSRDWLVNSLNILVERAIPTKEISSRGRLQGQRLASTNVSMTAGMIKDAERMALLLSKGVSVKEYVEKGVNEQVVTTLWLLSSPVERLVLSSGNPSASAKGINLYDISEVRFGKVSFTMDLSFPIRANMVTIIGSEVSLHLIVEVNSHTKLVTNTQIHAQTYNHTNTQTHTKNITSFIQDEVLRNKLVRRLQAFVKYSQRAR